MITNAAEATARQSTPSLFSRPSRANRTVIFHHIPKTAGSTLESILERHYAGSETFTVDRSRGVHESLFGTLHPAARANVRLIKGHMDFGVHKYVDGPCTYITVLRNPVERVISHYYYVRRSPNHRLYARVFYDQMTLEDYVSSGISLELNNGQVRSLVGPGHLEVDYGACTESMLDAARENLRNHFSVVGLTERFDETLLMIQAQLGWPRRPFYRRQNVSRSNPGSRGVSPEAIAVIESHNALDLALYREAADRFDEAFEATVGADELRRFRQWNRLAGPCLIPAELFRSAGRRLERLTGGETERSGGTVPPGRNQEIGTQSTTSGEVPHAGS